MKTDDDISTYKSFLHNAMSDFQINYEVEKNQIISAYYNSRLCMNDPCDGEDRRRNLFFLAFNNEKGKYIIRQIPVYFGKNILGEYAPTYDYDTYIDNYYRYIDTAILEYCQLLKNQVRYDIHDLWTDGVIELDNEDIMPYKMFHYDNPHTYFGRINEPYLWFNERWGEYIWKKLLMTCSGLVKSDLT